ncbi:30S ribosomal protein S4 [Candidatus Micrarchaeota archaeon]|nr:30S ribosomal protein S4 [Candidatus Micrarchaeota archaeon]
MGDPRKLRNKYARPKKLLDLARITEEKGLKREYALKNMRELWVAVQELKKYRREARRLLSVTEEERKKDAEKILNKLNKFGILPADAKLDDILSLDVKNILERRLQTIVYRKGLARTLRQSRQLITHGFIAIRGRKMSRPSYLMLTDEESTLNYAKKIDISVSQPAATEDKAKESS